MGRLPGHSLLIHVGAAMALIGLLASASMLNSVLIADALTGKAAAVNQAGSLRMQAYRVASYLTAVKELDPQDRRRHLQELTEQFEQSLTSPLITAALNPGNAHGTAAAYRRVVREWREKVRPLLEIYTTTLSAGEVINGYPEPEIRASAALTYLDRVDDFVAAIDGLVKALEVDAESRVQRLRLVQGMALILTVLVILASMYLLYRNVLVPLAALLRAAERVGRGEFSVRMGHTGPDELGRLGQAFNAMATDLSKLYGGLEALVRDKTRDLEHSNRTLELLYNTVNQLNAAPFPAAAYQALLETIQSSLGLGPGAICLAGSDGLGAVKLASSWPAGSDTSGFCSPPNCRACLGDGSVHPFKATDREGRRWHLISVPIRDPERQYGVLHLEIPAGSELETWQLRALEGVADHIGIAINLNRCATEGRRLALLEERGAIARELHDSLAQSLSYLKIQVSRLQGVLKAAEEADTARGIAEELREGLNSAYRQLRELLTTFRLKVDGREFGSVLEETVQEFSARSDVEIRLDNRFIQCQLTANEEIHVLQIVREALSNVIRHARASHANVRLDCDGEGRLRVRVEDDGRGMGEAPERRHHHGLTIMRERARSLRGELDVEPRPEGGTRVQLMFTPTDRQQMPGMEATHG